MGLEQPQYSRREKGEIQFKPDEITKLAQLLETTVSNLFGEENKLSNNNHQEKSSLKHILVPEKLIEQYELHLKEKNRLIEILSQKK